MLKFRIDIPFEVEAEDEDAARTLAIEAAGKATDVEGVEFFNDEDDVIDAVEELVDEEEVDDVEEGSDDLDNYEDEDDTTEGGSEEEEV